jgi:large subunit ribosomal protein L31
MKPNLHPPRYQVLAQCVCANQFYFYSALDTKTINVEVCNKCHPFYTKKQQVVSASGRAEHFNSKFSSFQDKKRQSAPSASVASTGKATKPINKVVKTVKNIKSSATSKVGKVDQNKKT